MSAQDGDPIQRRIVHALLVLAAFTTVAVAGVREPAPPFTARTLTGETFTNGSLSGQVVLLQFWTTWCQYCRRDQPVVDNIDRDLSDKGLVVLAVNVGESEHTVRKYLEERPRSCRVVLTEDTNLVATFRPSAFPAYIIIDRNGDIFGTQQGAAGERPLRQMLGRAGLGSLPGNTSPSTDQRPYAARTAAVSGSPKLVEVPRGRGPSAVPAKPLPPAIFVLANGEKLEAQHYVLTAASLSLIAGGQQRTIPISALDLRATVAANHERGVELRIPTNRNEISLGP